MFIACCANKEPQEMQLKPNNAIVIMGVTILNSGVQTEYSGFGDTDASFVAFADQDGNSLMHYRQDKGKKYAVIEVENPNSIHISGTESVENKVFYNKLRQYKIENLSANIEAGKVNYLGDLTFDWIPQTFAVRDLVNGIIPTNDDGTMNIKREENIDAVKAYLGQFPHLSSQELVVKKFNEHKLLAQ